MNLYEFRGANGDILEMNAETERLAREEIMYARWGDPDGVVILGGYFGRGLDLYNVIENTKRKAKPILRRK